MSIRVTCPECDTSNTVADEMRGKKIRCRECERSLSVPAGDDDDADEAVDDADEAVYDPKGKSVPSPGPRRGNRDEDDEPSGSRGDRDGNSSRPAKKGRSGLLPVLLIGCGSLLVLGVVGIAAVLAVFFLYARPSDPVPAAQQQADLNRMPPPDWIPPDQGPGPIPIVIGPGPIDKDQPPIIKDGGPGIKEPPPIVPSKEPGPKLDPDPKPKIDPDPKPKIDPDPKPKANPDPKPKIDLNPKPKTDPDPKPKTELTPKPKIEPQGPKVVFEVNSQLTTSDLLGGPKGRRCKTHEVKVEEGKTYVIEMQKVGVSRVDPYLQLLDPAGKVVAFDDNSGEKMNAKITYTAMQAGTYKVVATSVNLGVQTGAYHLTVTAVPPKAKE